MTEALCDLIVLLIQEEEQLNNRYTELANLTEQPHLAAQFHSFQEQGWQRLNELYKMWRSLQDVKC